jgi:hypothetical protein
LEFHDERILTLKKAAAETVLAVDPVKEIFVQTVEKDPFEFYSSSYDDSVFDFLDTDVLDGLILDEESWLKQTVLCCSKLLFY